MVSKRDQDLKRRQRDPGGGPATKTKAIWGGGVVAIAVVVFLLTRGGAEAGLASFQLDDDPFMGDPAAPIVLIGYESPHCSSCQRFHLSVLPDIQPLIDNGTVVYYYIQGAWGQAGGTERVGGMAQECAYREGGNAAFWDMTERIYARSNVYAATDWSAMLRSVAADHGLNPEPFVSCFEESKTSKAVSDDARVGRDHNARGTPTFWVFDGETEAPVDSFVRLPEILNDLAAARRG